MTRVQVRSHPAGHVRHVRSRLRSIWGAVAAALLVVACGSTLSELKGRLDALALPDGIVQVDEEVEPKACGFGVRSCPNLLRWFTSEKTPAELCEDLKAVVVAWETDTGEVMVRDEGASCTASAIQGGRAVHVTVYDTEHLAIYGSIEPEESVRSGLRVGAEWSGGG